MGVSTDGQLCYGILFEEGAEFPWNDEDKGFDGDIEAWWREVNGYKPPFELYDEHGEYLNGVEPLKERLDEYYDAETAWDKSHPLPTELVNYCSGQYPMYILAVPKTLIRASRGFPVDIEGSLVARGEEASERLRDFCRTYLGIEDARPKWYLSSYWG